MSWLNTDTIKKKVRHNADEATWRAFDNVYLVDTLLSAVTHYPIFIVLNTHPHNLNGEHWKVIFIGKDRRGKLFDSLGLAPNIPTQQWLRKHTRQYKRNERALQHPLSSTCGAFVLYFILKRLNVRRFESIIQKFSYNQHSNEKLKSQEN
mgnify:CR=1 FL=1